MIDNFAIAFLLTVAVLAIHRIHRERRDHDREIDNARHRFYRGPL